jgi:hypothetical protein
MDQLTGILDVSSHAQSKDHFALSSISQLEWDLNGATGIQGGSHLSGQP